MHPVRGGPRERRAAAARRPACSPRARACTTPPTSSLDAPPERGAARARALSTATRTTSCRTARSIIVDEFTGRLMPGRRWSDGLHQAVEAKEGVPIQSENQTLASITFQNYFRMYSKLAGMTGTADTEAYEFQQIYGLETVVIPTHRPMVRKDKPDLRLPHARRRSTRRSSRTSATATSAASRCWSARRRSRTPSCCPAAPERESLPHEVLNAKQHEREAEIVAQAGRPGVITIATNMAGRGTDIVLGGNVEPQVRSCASRRDARRGREGSADREAARRVAGAARRRWSRPAACTSSAPSATSRAASTTSCAAAPAARAIPGSSRFYLSLEES